jgi:tRNA threonylcarbamoyl adenosine modification protein YeaZ
MQRGHAEALPACVETALACADTKLGDIDLLAAGCGPGTFTGVRIALSFVKGLALVLKVPVVGVSTFEALAADQLDTVREKEVWVVMDARRGEVYVQGFRSIEQSVCEPSVLTIAAANQLLQARSGVVVGSGTGLLMLPDSLEVREVHPVPDVRTIARLASTFAPDQHPAAPFYLRRPDAKAQQELVQHRAIQVEIGRAGPEHAHLLAHLHAGSFENGWNESAFAELLSQPGALALTASVCKEGMPVPQPIGFVMARAVPDEMEILTISVASGSRRRGVASSLLKALQEEARRAGTQRIFLEYAADNEAAAALYRRLGFEKTGVRRGYYKREGGITCDAITACLQLASTKADSCAAAAN